MCSYWEQVEAERATRGHRRLADYRGRRLLVTKNCVNVSFADDARKTEARFDSVFDALHWIDTQKSA